MTGGEATEAEILANMLSGEIATRGEPWQNLIRSVGLKPIGDIGERYAAEMLRARGHQTRHVGGNNAGWDLAVEAFNGKTLPREILIEVKVCRDKTCVRDTWGSWHSRER